MSLKQFVVSTHAKIFESDNENHNLQFSIFMLLNYSYFELRLQFFIALHL